MNKEGGRLSVLLITVENSRRIGSTSDTGHPHVGGGTPDTECGPLKDVCSRWGRGGLGLVPGCNSLLQGLDTAYHPGVCGLMSELLSTE